jgi:hypothetical protein
MRPRWNATPSPANARRSLVPFGIGSAFAGVRFAFAVSNRRAFETTAASASMPHSHELTGRQQLACTGGLPAC